MSQEIALKEDYDVVVAGHICLDIIPEIPATGAKTIGEIMTPGKLINVGDAAVSTGGPVSNTGIALKKLGLKVAFMSKIGDDDFGALILNRLQNQGNAQGIQIAVNAASSYTVAIAPPGIDRIFLHNPGTNSSFTSKEVNYNLVRRARVFHLGYPTLMKGLYEDNGREFKKIIKQAKQAGATTSVDMSLPDSSSPSARVKWLEILKELLPDIDIFLPSIEEAYFFADKAGYLKTKARAANSEIIDFIEPSLYSKIAKQFLEYGAKIVALKTGHRGFYLRTTSADNLNKAGRGKPGHVDNWANRELWCPAFHVKNIASATGSGDSSIAGFYAAFLRGFSIEKTLKYANCLGYRNLHHLDALSGIGSWNETQKLVESGKLEMNELPLQETGWQWDSAAKIWIGPNE